MQENRGNKKGNIENIQKKTVKPDEYFRQGNYNGFFSQFIKLIELNPKNIDAYGFSGNAYSMKGNYDQVISYYTKGKEQ